MKTAGCIVVPISALLAAPDLVVNAGVHPRLELVLEGRGLVPREAGEDLHEVRAGLTWTFDWARGDRS